MLNFQNYCVTYSKRVVVQVLPVLPAGEWGQLAGQHGGWPTLWGNTKLQGILFCFLHTLAKYLLCSVVTLGQRKICAQILSQIEEILSRIFPK